MIVVMIVVMVVVMVVVVVDKRGESNEKEHTCKHQKEIVQYICLFVIDRNIEIVHWQIGTMEYYAEVIHYTGIVESVEYRQFAQNTSNNRRHIRRNYYSEVGG
jgi:hypothetical protein